MSFLHENEKWCPYQRLVTYPRFETEARGNSEMAYSQVVLKLCIKERQCITISWLFFFSIIVSQQTVFICIGGWGKGTLFSPYFFMIAVETIALAVCQNTVINGISTCDEDTNNDDTTAVLFDMTSAPAPFKPGGTQQSFIPRGSAPRSNPWLYVPFLTKKVRLLY